MKESKQKSKKEVNEAYNKLTDDEKRREKVELKKEFNVYAEDMGQYLKDLNDDDRAYVEEKFKITTLQQQDFTLDELFQTSLRHKPQLVRLLHKCLREGQNWRNSLWRTSKDKSRTSSQFAGKRARNFSTV